MSRARNALVETCDLRSAQRATLAGWAPPESRTGLYVALAELTPHTMRSSMFSILGKL